ncbi:type VII secretion target [Nocardia sp. CA-107356]|uniref:type VII secretion target n=1 Tax=Nocardia sp. CA-107356 TaxID=3239972 RepID=UPI003D942D33
MTRKVEVDPVILRTPAALTTEIHNEILQALTTLQSALPGLDEPWGKDEIGASFAPDYKKSLENLKQNATAMATAANDLATGLAQAADLHEVQEQNNKNLF